MSRKRLRAKLLDFGVRRRVSSPAVLIELDNVTAQLLELGEPPTRAGLFTFVPAAALTSPEHPGLAHGVRDKPSRVAVRPVGAIPYW